MGEDEFETKAMLSLRGQIWQQMSHIYFEKARKVS